MDSELANLKLKERIRQIWFQSTSDTCAEDIEQAFLEAGWQPPQQPAEGELVGIEELCQIAAHEMEVLFEMYTERKVLKINMELAFKSFGEKVQEAQLAHMKAQGWVKWPSEEAHELLKLLKERKK